MSRKQLGQELVERGVLSSDELEAVLEQQDRAERLGETLVKEGLVSKADVGAALEAIKGVPYAEKLPSSIPADLLGLIPAPVARRCSAVPLSIDGNTLVVVMAEPQNVSQLEELTFSAGMEVSARFGFTDDVRRGIQRFYGEAPRKASEPPSDDSPVDETVSRADPPGRDGVGWFAYAAIGVGVCCAFVFGLTLGDSLGLVGNETGTEGMPPPFSLAVLEPILTTRDDGHVIQVGVYRDQANAEQLASQLELMDERVEITPLPGKLYSVTMGPFPDKEVADRIAREIRREMELSPFVLPDER